MPTHRLQARQHRGRAWEVRVDVQHLVSPDEAAESLALVYAGEPAYRGYVKLRTGLSLAARRRAAGKWPAGEEADPELVDAYRKILDEQHAEFFKYEEDGKPRGRFDEPVFVNLEQAARGLARLWPKEVPRRFGLATAERGVQEIARRRMLDDQAPVDAEMVATYRELLVKVKMFPG